MQKEKSGVKRRKVLLGTFKPTIIGKNRLALPVKLRREIPSRQLVLSVGFEKCIFGFEEKKWEDVTAADLARPLSDMAGRNLRRKLCMNASTISLDSQGRFVIPEEMARYAAVKEDITIIGAGDHFEIWNTKEWEIYRQKLEKLSRW